MAPELRSFLRAIARSSPGAVHLVRCADPSVRRRIIEEVLPEVGLLEGARVVEPGLSPAEALRLDAPALHLLTPESPEEARRWWSLANRHRGAFHRFPGIVLCWIRSDLYSVAADAAPDLFHTRAGSFDLDRTLAPEPRRHPPPPPEILKAAREVYTAAWSEGEVPFAPAGKRRVLRAEWSVERHVAKGYRSPPVKVWDAILEHPGLLVEAGRGSGATWLCQDLALRMVQEGLALPLVVDGEGLSEALSAERTEDLWGLLRGHMVMASQGIAPEAPRPWCWLLVDGFRERMPVNQSIGRLAGLGVPFTVFGLGVAEPMLLMPLLRESLRQLLVARVGESEVQKWPRLEWDRWSGWAYPLRLLAIAAVWEQLDRLPRDRAELSIALVERMLVEEGLRGDELALGRSLVLGLAQEDGHRAAAVALRERLETLGQEGMEAERWLRRLGRLGQIVGVSDLRLGWADVVSKLSAVDQIDSDGLLPLERGSAQRERYAPLGWSSHLGMRVVRGEGASSADIWAVSGRLWHYRACWFAPPRYRPALEREEVDQWSRNLAELLAAGIGSRWDREIATKALSWHDPRLPAPTWTEVLPNLYLNPFLVTWTDFEPFIFAYGYNDPRWWSEAGFAWLRSQPRRAPPGWDPLFLNPVNAAIRGVTAHEADAVARWLGARLPTPDEWRAILSSDQRQPPDVESPPADPVSPPYVGVAKATRFPSGLVWDLTGLLQTWALDAEGRAWICGDGDPVAAPADEPMDTVGIRLVRDHP